MAERTETWGIMDSKLLPFSRPKQWYLAFDKVAVSGLSSDLPRLSKFWKDEHLLNNIHWLTGIGFIEDLDRDWKAKLHSESVQSLLETEPCFEFVKQARRINASFDRDRFKEILESGTETERREALRDWVLWLETAGTASSRYWSILLSDEKLHPVPIIGELSRRREKTKKPTSSPVKEHSCMRLVLSQIPEPDDDVPWEELQAFKSESGMKLSYNRLQRLMRQMASGSTKLEDIQDEISLLAEEYESFSNRIKTKSSKSMIEWLIVTPIEMIEDAVRFKWSKIAKAIFSIDKSNDDEAIALAQAPGQDVAYIVQSREKFPSNPE